MTPVKTRFVTRFHMLDSLLEQKKTVDHCFTEIAPEKFRSRAPTEVEWIAVAQYHKVLEYPSKVVIKAEDKGHWFLSDAG